MSSCGRALFKEESPGDLAEAIRHEIDEHVELLELSKGKDIVAVLGNTGSGKSTTLNWLANKELVVGKRNKILLKDESDLTAMAIGNTGEAMTKYPCSIQIDGLLFFDLPGFRDTGGMVCDLINAAFIKAILENAKSVRVMFFAGENEVTATRGELFKTLLTGLENMFGKDSRVLRDSSFLIITKSEQDGIDELRDFLEEEVPDKYLKSLETWMRSGRLFQVKKPVGKQVCQDGKAEIMRALQCPGQKLEHVNVDAMYSKEVDVKLKEVISCILSEVLSSFMPSPDEKQLSSLMKAIETVKGDLDDKKYIKLFWRRFESHVETIPTVKLLKPLFENVFSETIGEFEGTKWDMVKRTVDNWESQFDSLSMKIQNELVCRIDSVSSEQAKQLRETFSSLDGIHDVKSGEEKLKKLKGYLKRDMKGAVEKVVREDSELRRIVDQDPEYNNDLLKEAMDRFTETVLKELEESIRKSIESAIELVESKIQTYQLESDMHAKTDEMKRLSDQVEQERKEKERLSKEITRFNEDSAKHEKRIKELEEKIERERKMRAEAEAERSRRIQYIEVSPYSMPAIEHWGGGSGRGPRSSGGRSSSPSGGGMSWGQAYRMYSGGGYTQKEIGEMMGCSQSTVSRHFKKFK